MPKAAFLSDVQHRLKNDVGPYFATIRAVHQKTGHWVGFWALARMLFPIVEAVATVIYRSGPRNKRPALLLKRLGVKYPNLVWEMFRHTLMHNDEMASASYKGRRVTWEIRLGGGHVARNGHLAFDVRRLYADLKTFFSREIAEARRGSTQVWVRESFRFSTRFARATLDEILRLGKK